MPWTGLSGGGPHGLVVRSRHVEDDACHSLTVSSSCWEAFGEEGSCPLPVTDAARG